MQSAEETLRRLAVGDRTLLAALAGLGTSPDPQGIGGPAAMRGTRDSRVSRTIAVSPVALAQKVHWT